MRRADVIVIGAGVLGAFHAYFAARKGLKVLLLERNALPNDASVRNFGMIPRTIVGTEGPWAGFARASADLYRAIQREHDISVSQRGSLYIGSTALENTVLQEFAQRFADRYNCLYIDKGDLLARYPFIRDAYARGGLHFPGDLGLDPRVMLRRLIPYLGALGVEYAPETSALAVEVAGHECRVQTGRDTSFVAGHVFICSGADTATLFREVLAESGLRVCKLQMMRTVPLPGVRLSPSILSGLSIRRYPAFSSCPSYPLLQAEGVGEKLIAYGIHLLFKQEADGSVVIGDSHHYAAPADAATFQERTDCDVNDTILAYARSMLRLPSWHMQTLWNGYYLVHDSEPIFTRTIDGRIHIATGIGGKGMATGPGFAQHSIATVFG
ncbi:MAG: TIGR03364 family FAD-dependent oxidoreductase [Chloroflexi bacterium]|nr:TIGR03364 family FAD-dependent oxidoreductase [Chloroflexota bacterium]